MRCRVQPHIPRACGRRDILDDPVTVGAVLMNHGQRTVGVRCEHIASSGIVACAVHTHPDRQCRDGFSGLIIRDRQNTAPATAEQAMMRGVDRHGDRLFARSSGPSPGHRCRLRVDLDDLADIGQIGIDLAIARRNAIFRLAAEVDVRDPLPRNGIDNRRGMRVTIEREHAIRNRIVNDGVGIFGCRNSASSLNVLASNMTTD